MQTVTLDFSRARNLRCHRGSRCDGPLKAYAHARTRRIVRDWLQTGDPDDPPVVHPVTGRDLV